MSLWTIRDSAKATASRARSFEKIHAILTTNEIQDRHLSESRCRYWGGCYGIGNKRPVIRMLKEFGSKKEKLDLRSRMMYGRRTMRKAQVHCGNFLYFP
jgi:hypothetical protein